jgi:glycosyltransferase involved in cell wall biosynthesis
MRILVVQESDWIEKGPHQSHHLMERLNARGHAVKIIDFEILWKNHGKQSVFSKRRIFRDIHKAIPDGGVTVVRPSIIRLPLIDYLSLLITHRREIRRQLEEFKPDIIVGFGILNANLALRFARKKRIPFVYYIIDELHRLVPQKALRGIARRIEMANMEGSDLVISINDALRDYTISMGARRENTSIIKAGIDIERFNLQIDKTAIRRSLNISENDLVLFFMGWLYKFSGLTELTEELRRNPKKYGELRLLIIGKGELWDYLVNARNGDLKEKMILLNWQPYEKIPAFIAASDICILPAQRNEIMQNIVPIKMYEYMAMAKPIIATDLKGLRMEFGEENGVMYIERPEQALTLAFNLKREARIEKEGAKARKFVEHNDWETIGDQFEAELKALISKRRMLSHSSLELSCS